MHEHELLIYGAGGHGLVVAESAEAADQVVRGFLDDTRPVDASVGKWRIVGRGESGEAEGWDLLRERLGTSGGVIVAIGENAARWHLMNVLRGAAVHLATVIDPTARVSPSASVGPGVYIGAHAAVNAEAEIGAGAIVNSAAVIEHHVKLGIAAHVGPGAVMTGRAEAGDRALVGANATVLPGRLVGEDAVVGAGAVVTHDVPIRTVVAGCPATVMEK